MNVVLRTLTKLRTAEMSESETKKGNLQPVGCTKVWLEEQDAYTLHRPVGKRFACNPYTVTNVRDLWEWDLLDVESYAKYNDNFQIHSIRHWCILVISISDPCEDKEWACSHYGIPLHIRR